MSKEVKEIMNKVKSLAAYYDVDHLGNTDTRYVYDKLKDYITSLEEKVETEHKAYMGTVKELTETATENEHLSKQNNDLRKIYVNTSNRLFKNGNDELARYFQAQINECPTFTVAPIIDYYQVLKNIKQDLDLELNKTRANDEYNKGLFNEALYIRKQIEKYEGDINAN